MVTVSSVLVIRQSGSPLNPAELVGFAKPATAPACVDSQPRFEYGFAALKAQLGSVMGDPLECEHSIHVNGDTRQRTTTGYAYYRTDANVPAFTDGWDHWALTEDGLVYWTGDVVDPPTSQFDARGGGQ
jgi:hypothetical protein